MLRKPAWRRAEVCTRHRGGGRDKQKQMTTAHASVDARLMIGLIVVGRK